VPSPLIESLFCTGIVAAQLSGAPDVTALTPDEARACLGVSQKRRDDFAAGRICARRALREFGYDAFSLLAGDDRRPRWPDGIVGSISHTHGFCGVAVADAERYESVGFDVEEVGRVGEELWPNLFTAFERSILEMRSGAERATLATLLFSAKEAFYKCRYGVTPGWLDFTDVTIVADADDERCGTFAVRCGPQEQAERTSRVGRYALSGDLVLTGIATP